MGETYSYPIDPALARFGVAMHALGDYYSHFTCQKLSGQPYYESSGKIIIPPTSAATGGPTNHSNYCDGHAECDFDDGFTHSCYKLTGQARTDCYAACALAAHDGEYGSGDGTITGSANAEQQMIASTEDVLYYIFWNMARQRFSNRTLAVGYSQAISQVESFSGPHNPDCCNAPSATSPIASCPGRCYLRYMSDVAPISAPPPASPVPVAASPTPVAAFPASMAASPAPIGASPVPTAEPDPVAMPFAPAGATASAIAFRRPGWRRYLLLAAIAAAIFVGDRASKRWAERSLRGAPAIEVVPGYFHFRYVANSGAAWGILSGARESLRRPFFVVVSTLAIAFIVILLWRSHAEQRLLHLALALLFGGALGNFVDRLQVGFVVDFIDWHYRDRFRWPTFNIADVGITLGVALLLLEMLRGARPRVEAGASQGKESVPGRFVAPPT